jgi:hypothetical protein
MFLNVVVACLDFYLIFCSVTLSVLEATCLELRVKLPAWKMRILDQIVEMLQWFAGIHALYVKQFHHGPYLFFLHQQAKLNFT